MDIPRGTVAVIIALVILSAFFSASETAFLAMNSIRMKNLAAEGKKRAKTALELSAKYDRLLSSILIGNNVVNILASSLGTVLFVGLLGSRGVTVSTVVITLVVLIFGEITPKTVAKEFPDKFAMFAAPLLRMLTVLLAPLSWLFGLWKKLVFKLFNSEKSDAISEDELLTYVEEVREHGGINEEEELRIRSAIEFDDLEAGEICTPRVNIVAVSENAPAAEISETFKKSGYSRLPVFRDSIDNIVGVLIQKDFHYRVVENGEAVAAITRPIMPVMKTIKLPKLLKELQQSKLHMAVIIDEYGGTFGLVTVEDIIEELVGDIWDEHDEIEHRIVPAGEGKFTVLGSTPLDELCEFFGISSESEATTAGGWAVDMLGRLPEEGEFFTLGALRVEVTSVINRRAAQLEVAVLETRDEEEY